MSFPLRLMQSAGLLLVGALGFAAGRGTVQPGEEALREELVRLRAAVEALDAQQPLPELRCALAHSASTQVDMAALRAEVAQVLREELASLPDSATKPEPRAPPPPSPQAVEAHREGLRLIEEASRTRQWREQDALAARRLLLQMTESQRLEVMRRISSTLNAGGIQVQVRGPPF